MDALTGEYARRAESGRRQERVNALLGVGGAAGAALSQHPRVAGPRARVGGLVLGSAAAGVGGAGYLGGRGKRKRAEEDAVMNKLIAESASRRVPSLSDFGKAMDDDRARRERAMMVGGLGSAAGGGAGAYGLNRLSGRASGLAGDASVRAAAREGAAARHAATAARYQGEAHRWSKVAAPVEQARNKAAGEAAAQRARMKQSAARRGNARMGASVNAQREFARAPGRLGGLSAFRQSLPDWAEQTRQAGTRGAAAGVGGARSAERFAARGNRASARAAAAGERASALSPRVKVLRDRQHAAAAQSGSANLSAKRAANEAAAARARAAGMSRAASHLGVGGKVAAGVGVAGLGLAGLGAGSRLSRREPSSV